MNTASSRDFLERLQRALPNIRKWIDALHTGHASHGTAVVTLGLPRLASAFPATLLQRARTVTVSRIPFPPVSDYGLPEFELQGEFELGRDRPDLFQFVSDHALSARRSAEECFKANGLEMRV